MDLRNPTPTNYKMFNKFLKNISKILMKFYTKWTYLGLFEIQSQIKDDGDVEFYKEVEDLQKSFQSFNIEA